MRTFLTAGRIVRTAPALIAAAVLLGCGSGENSGGVSSTPKPGHAPVRKAAPGGAISANMVSAVSGAHTGSAAVQLKFELRERPSAARPLEIDLVVLPGPVDRVYGRVEVPEGLELSDGAQIAPTDRPVEAVPVRHTVRVLPKRDGIFTISAVVSVETGGQTSTQTFSIPVIVGAGLPETPTKPASTAATAKPAATR